MGELISVTPLGEEFSPLLRAIQQLCQQAEQHPLNGKVRFQSMSTQPICSEHSNNIADPKRNNHTAAFSTSINNHLS
ncbi:hypothetical protein [Oceanicoccus sp. KOV_DT_Chl]|uniref:hypothetical protein n=1 Tax=Oceanicoccus sp. KOV_DT_Chl TaxID=1904639 RepID=UPI000C7D75A3|nr:hypothetical protein [Oceanicoccus sp. KOV_DT_Chl]